MIDDSHLTARIEPFDSFWEAPQDIERGYDRFERFYKHNYRRHLPREKRSRVLVVSCGPGYFVRALGRWGYTNVMGIDSSSEKIVHARRYDLNCKIARAFDFLKTNREPFDVIIAEQEVNHLTKTELLAFLAACIDNLSQEGRVIVHSINGASPITGSESLAGNFDHYHSLTEYSLRQVLQYGGLVEVEVFPLNLYVFWSNPLNYAAMAIHFLSTLFFRLNFKLVGKDARLFTKKIGAVGLCPASRQEGG